MQARVLKNTTIIKPNIDTLDFNEEKILNLLDAKSNCITFDFAFISSCTPKFLTALMKLSSKYTISIFNIPSDIFVLFNIMKIDKIAKLYVSELDYIEKSRQLINRKFSLVK